MQPEISVITPVYNVAKYLTETVNLILSQTFQNFELIILDDKSTDNTWQIAQELAQKDSRIRTIKLPKNIIGYIRNYAVSAANGKYIMFIDGDDIPDKTFLEKMYKSITENDTDISMCKFEVFDNVSGAISDKHEFGSVNYKKMLKKVFSFKDIKRQIFSIPNVIWNKIYRKDFLIENDIKFPEDIILCEDLVFSVKCLIKAKKLSYIDENLLLYRVNRSDSASECKDETFFNIFRHYEILKENFEKNNIYDDVKLPYLQDAVYTFIYYLSKIKKQYRHSFYKKMQDFLLPYREDDVEYNKDEVEDVQYFERYKLSLKKCDRTTYSYLYRITKYNYYVFLLLLQTDKIINLKRFLSLKYITRKILKSDLQNNQKKLLISIYKPYVRLISKTIPNVIFKTIPDVISQISTELSDKISELKDLWQEKTDRIKILLNVKYITRRILKSGLTVGQKKFILAIITHSDRYNLMSTQKKVKNSVIVLKEKHLFEKYNDKSELPKNIRLDVCTLCQLKCPECYMRKYPEDVKNGCGLGYLKFKDFKKFVDENELETIELSNSGEIFLNPDLVKILKYAHKKHITLTAHNGVNLNTLSDEQAEAVVKYNLDVIVVSLDGASQETYSQYRINGNYDNVINNIKKINFYKKKYDSCSPHMVWKFIVFGHNEHEIEKAKIEAEKLNMEITFDANWESEYSPIKDKEKVLAQTNIHSLDVNTSPVEQLDEFEKGLVDWYFCWDLWEPQINWDGRILGCCANFKEDFGGNVFKEGFLNALNNPTFVYAKNMVTHNARGIKAIPCFDCWVYQDMRDKNRWMKSPKRTGKI
ncbi:MAG: glycosyltransferase [Candidatus Gastranaerophilales bacterium]|nr:glycosyltransferase [Candidatus Gastranaerophilales bacterium]